MIRTWNERRASDLDQSMETLHQSVLCRLLQSESVEEKVNIATRDGDCRKKPKTKLIFVVQSKVRDALGIEGNVLTEPVLARLVDYHRTRVKILCIKVATAFIQPTRSLDGKFAKTGW